MTDFTYTLALPVLLDQQSSSEILIDEAWDLLDTTAIGAYYLSADLTGVSTLNLSVANQTTGVQGSITASYIKLTGTPSAGVTVQLPNIFGSSTVYVAKNNLLINNTTAQTITVQAHASGSTVTIGAGKKYVIYCDGTNVLISDTSIALSGLSDVTITSVADGDGLLYNSGTSKWVNSNTVLTTTNTKTVTNKTVSSASNTLVLGGVTVSGSTGTGGSVVYAASPLLTGNIGINAAATAYPLEVRNTGSGTTVGSNTAAYLNVSGGGLDVNLRFGDGSNPATVIGSLSGRMYFYTNGAERATIDSSGRLLIGSSTNHSGEALQVTGAGYFSGDVAAGTVNKVTITTPATGSTLTIANGKTLTASNSVTFAGTDGSTLTYGTGGTLTYTSNNLSVFAATTSAQLAGVISDETGSGALVFATSPTLVTPVLGVASATTINKVTITTPATGSTLTVADGKTATVSNTLTFTGTDSSSVAFSAGGTVAYTANNLSAFASTTSSQLAGVISDETGSGSLVFANTPTLVTPVLGVATGTSVALTAASTINANTTSASPPTGTLLQLTNANSTSTFVVLDAYAGAPNIIGRRAAGTAASPTATASGNALLQMAGYGYTGSAFSTSSKVALGFESNEAWSTTANGTRIVFYTTLNGTTTLAEKARITDMGTFQSIHLAGSSGAPTISAGAGAGTGPTVSVSGNDTSMQVTVTTGTLPTGAGATIATVTYNTAFSATPHPVWSVANANAALLNGASMISIDGASTTTFTIIAGTTGLTASTTYNWNVYTVG